MTSHSESSDQSLNGDTLPSPAATNNKTTTERKNEVQEQKAKKKKYKGAEKVLSIFASPR